MTMGRARIQKETKHSKDGRGFFSALDKVKMKFLQFWKFKLYIEELSDTVVCILDRIKPFSGF